MSSPADSVLESLFADPSLGKVWTAALTTVLGASLAWSYALLIPLSVIPAQRGAFGFLGPEAAMLRLPRWMGKFLHKQPLLVAGRGNHWKRLHESMAADYTDHRRVHVALFSAARSLAVAASVTSVGLSALCFVYAIRDASGTAAWLGGASLVYATFPFIITIMAARYRWRRRAPFELLWLHESMVVLGRHEKQFLRKQLERAEILSDLGDIEYILMQRHRGSGSGSAGELAQSQWTTLVASHSRVSAAFQGQRRPTSDEVWLWLHAYTDRISGPIHEGETTSSPAALSLEEAPRKRPTYSADSAGTILLVSLGVAFACLVAAAAWSAGVRLTSLPWDLVSPGLATATSLVPVLGALGAVVRIVRKGRAEL
jgi:hypothetical protein